MGFFGNLLNGLTGGLVGAVSGIGNSVLGGLFGAGQSALQAKQMQKLQQQNFEYSKQLMEHQYDLQKSQFDYTNAYNDPSQQMARMKAAGLNPNLANGQIATASMPSVSAGHMTQANPASIMQNQLDLMRQFRENAIMGQQSNILAEQAEGLRLDNAYKRNTLDDRTRYQGDLAEQMFYLANKAKSESRMKEFEYVQAREIHNINQLLLHGIDGEFKYPYFAVSESAQNSYIEDLETSDLYNSIKATMKAKSLSNDEMTARIGLLGKQIEKYIQDIRYMNAHAAVEEFYANLAAQGLNPRDPLWARVIVEFLAKLGISPSDMVANGVKKVIKMVK